MDTNIGEYAMNTTFINTPVDITAVGFGRDMSAYPKRMEWAGKTYHFIDKGICVTSRRGEKITSTLTMSDGHQSFSLRNVGSQWLLIGIY